MKDLSLKDFSSENEKELLIDSLCKSEGIDISIVYCSDFKSAKLLREIVDDLCKKCGINTRWRSRLVLIIDELNNNAIEYWSQQGDDNYMNIKLSKKSDTELFIDVSVIDSWQWDHAKNADDMLILKKKNENKDFSNHDSIRWRGLFLIISHLVDELYFEDSDKGGLIVGARKLLSIDLEK
jgi:anti-sigma regulatory factor (Ser/Thr protein kinase)